MSQSIDKSLLQKFIEGHCTPDEEKQVKAFMLTPEAKGILQELLDCDWREFKNDKPVSDAQIRNFHQRLQLRLRERDTRPVRRINIYRYAAIWIFLLSAVGIYTVWKFNNRESAIGIAMITRSNTYDKPTRIVLPDSSVVMLGAGSKLIYPNRFQENIREITLEGEAFFDVTKNPQQPFIVHTGSIQTRVLGTSFKIDAFSNEPVVVSVATGKVGVSNHSGDTTTSLALLTPGLRVTWNRRTHAAVQDTVDIYNLEQWKTGNMIFDEQPLSEVAKVLQRRYGLTIVLTDHALAASQVSGTFAPDVAPEKVIKMLSIAGRFRYTVSDTKVEIFK